MLSLYIVFSTGSPFKINKLQQLSLSRHVYNLRSLVAVIPSSLCAESGSHDFVDAYDHLDQPVSILINVSGKLLMIQQDRSASIENSKVSSGRKLMFYHLKTRHYIKKLNYWLILL